MIGQASVKYPMTVPGYRRMLIGQPGPGHRVLWLGVMVVEGSDPLMEVVVHRKERFFH